MARRAGKAASRKARQRYQPRTPRPAPTPSPETGTEADATSVEVVDATPAAVETPRKAAPVAYATGGSSLSARDRAEYHYVERDLRNIGILTLVMAIILVIAWFAFNAMGLI